MSTEPFTIRALGYSDLPQVIAIERRSFPTPWSLSMFVLELSKPSGVCLAAIETEPRRMIGYLICSRYDTIWHLMNVAVDVDHHGARVVELARAQAGRAPLGQRCPGRRQLLDAVVPVVGDVEITRAVGSNAARIVELSRTPARRPVASVASPYGQDTPGQVELLNAVVTAIRDVQMLEAVGGDSTGTRELPGSCPQASDYR